MYGFARAMEVRRRPSAAAVQQSDGRRAARLSEKSLFIQGYLHGSFLDQVTQSILHVLDEWAKVAPGYPSMLIWPGFSDWRGKTGRIACFFSVQKTSHGGPIVR